MSEQKYHTISMRNKYATMSVRQFKDTNSFEITAFLQTKLTMAVEALLEFGMSKSQVAERLGLASADAVTMMVLRWGKNAK